MAKSVLWNTGIDPSGYSSCARSYIKALHENKKFNVNVKIENIARQINSLGLDQSELDFFSNLHCDNIEDFDYYVQHSVPDRFKITRQKNIGYTVVEMKPPSRWVCICNQFDVVMTASNFCKEMMVNYGIREEIVKVIPHCHDWKIWNPNVKPLNIKNLKSFNFLFMGDYTPRKNGDLLIRNFIKTFRGNKDVSLTIKGYFRSFEMADQVSLLERIEKVVRETDIPMSEVPSIFFYGNSIPESLVPRFMSSFDCLVSPHRGEGWGLLMSQMQFLGKPVIATGKTGNLDFMNDEISYLIDVVGYEKVCEEMALINPNFRDKEWLAVNEDSLCDLLKEVYFNPNQAKEKGLKAAEYMRKNFSYKPISQMIYKALR